MKSILSILLACAFVLPLFITPIQGNLTVDTPVFGDTEPYSTMTRSSDTQTLDLKEPLNGNRNLLADDEIFVNFLHNTVQAKVNYPPDDLTHISTIGTKEQVDLGVVQFHTADLANVAGRFRNLSHDSVVTIMEDNYNGLCLKWIDPGTSSQPMEQSDVMPISVGNIPIVVGISGNLNVVAADFNGDSYDEIVICADFFYGNLILIVVSLSNSSTPTFEINVESYFLNWGENDSTAHLSGSPDALSATAGDFNNDGTPEVAVIYHDSVTKGYYMSIYEVSSDLSVITRVSTTDLGIINGNKITCDIGSGDINGDGQQNIIIAAGGTKEKGTEPFPKEKYDILWVQVFNMTSNLTSADIIGDYTDYYTFSSSDNAFTISDISLAIGDFDWDMKDDVFVWAARIIPSSSHVAGFHWTFYNPYEEFILSDTDGAVDASDVSSTIGTVLSAQDLGAIHGVVTAGNFDKQDPNYEVVLIHRGHDDYCQLLVYDFKIISSNDGTHKYIMPQEVNYDHSAKMTGRPMDVIAGDFDGDGIILGAPVHYRIEGRIVPLIEMDAPPQHIDYMMSNDNSATVPEVQALTVNNNGFNVRMGTETTTTVKASVTTSNTLDMGVSATVGATADIGIPKTDDVVLTSSVTAGFENKGVDATGTTSSTTVSVTTTDTADRDDYVYFTKSDIDIWRYPIIGREGSIENGTTGQLFAQLVIPTNTRHDKASGRVLDWYQPVQQVGNIFTYSWTNSDQSLVNTLQDYSGNGGMTQNPDWNPQGLSTTSHNSYKVHWGATEDSYDSRTVTNSYNVGATIGVTGTASEPGVAQVSGSLQIKTSLGNTFSQASTTSTTMSQGQYFELNTPGFSDDAYSYPFITGLYADQTAMRVQHAIDLDVNQLGTMWQSTHSGYNSGKSDPALNLPQSYVTSSGFGFNENGFDRFDMKGVMFLHQDGSPSGPLFMDGETIDVMVRVYNFAFVETPSPVKVSVRLLESSNQHVWSDSGIVLNGDTQTPIPAWGNDIGTPNWLWAQLRLNTTGLEGKYLKFMVVIDPDDEISEVQGHDLGVNSLIANASDLSGLDLFVQDADKYTNNVGLFVQNVYVLGQGSANASIFSDLKLLAQSPPINASNVNPSAGESVILKVKVASIGGLAHGATISFYDGNPEDGGILFDTEFIPFVKANEHVYVRANWQAPNVPGEYDIYAVIDEGMYETNNSNNVEIITLTVQKSTEVSINNEMIIAGIFTAGLIAIIITVAYRKNNKGK